MAETDKRQQQLQQAAREMAARQANAARQQAAMRAQRGAGAQAQSTAARQAAQAQNRTAAQQTARARSAAAAQPQNRVTGQQAVAQEQRAAATQRQAAQAQNTVTVAGKQQTAQASLSQTKEIENRLVQEVAEMMDQESFGDLVFFDTEVSSQNKKSAADTDSDEKKTEKKQSKKFGVGKKSKETDLQEAKEIKKETDLTAQREEQIRHWGAVGQWFQTFCWMHIPIFGFWYMVVLAIRKKTPEEKRTFARGYVLYRILVFILALTIIYVFYRMGLSFIEQILAYVDAHS